MRQEDLKNKVAVMKECVLNGYAHGVKDAVKVLKKEREQVLYRSDTWNFLTYLIKNIDKLSNK